MPPSLRFVVLAWPAAVLALALVGWAAGLVGAAPDLGPLAARGVARAEGLPAGAATAAALFEGLALVAFYLLVEGRTGSRVADGAVAGLAAWLFRGPLLVVAVATLTRLPTAPFWGAARLWLVALPAAGLLVGLVAHWTLAPRPEDEAGATAQVPRRDDELAG